MMNPDVYNLTFFPNPSPGETVYSVMCYIQSRSGLQEKIILNELTGQRNKAPLLQAIPSYISTIAKRVPNGNPWQDGQIIVSNHTALPYFSYFDPPEIRKSWLEKVIDSTHAQPIGLSLGFSVYRKKVAPEHPRYCIQCAKDQTEEFGYPYFRREHQLHWVNVCWKHGTVLSHGCSICGPYPIKKAGLSLPGRCLCADGASFLASASVDRNDREHYKWLAVQSAYMVNSNGMPFENIRTTLKAMCIEKGISRGLLLDRRSLADEVNRRFGDRFLHNIGYPAWNNTKPCTWISRLFDTSKSYTKRKPVIQYLLVIGALFDSVAQFESDTVKKT
jgi:hypothetical protein